MKLEFITTETCPICGESDVISESVEVSNNRGSEPEIREHVHGGKWEKRRFLCGYEIEYCPNGSKEERSRYAHCMHSPELIEKTRRQKKAHDAVLSYIETYNDRVDEADKVDERFKVIMYDEIKSLRHWFKS